AAATALSAGLALWRGPALAEFGGCAALDSEAARLEQLRLGAGEGGGAGGVGGGGGGAPGGGAGGGGGGGPRPGGGGGGGGRGGGLYGAGRRADALEAYRRAGSALVEELGVDPGRQLQETEQLVLAHDPTLDSPRSAPGRASVPAPEPLPVTKAVPEPHSVPEAEPEPEAERRSVVVAAVDLAGGAAGPAEMAREKPGLPGHVPGRGVAPRGGGWAVPRAPNI